MMALTGILRVLSIIFFQMWLPRELPNKHHLTTKLLYFLYNDSLFRYCSSYHFLLYPIVINNNEISVLSLKKIYNRFFEQFFSSASYGSKWNMSSESYLMTLVLPKALKLMIHIWFELYLWPLSLCTIINSSLFCLQTRLGCFQG